jgi:hypothetical protein
MSMKRHPLVLVAIAAFAVIGLAVLALNVGWNLGIVPICGESQEHSVVSPDGKNVVILGTAHCGTDQLHLTAKLVDCNNHL